MDADARATEVPADFKGKAEFYYKSVERFADWLKYQDTKAAGAAALLGLGMVNLLENSKSLTSAYQQSPSELGWVVTIAFWLAIPVALFALFAIIRVFGPHVIAHEDSLYFWGNVAKYANPSSYKKAVQETNPPDLVGQVASQAWQLAAITAKKTRWVKVGFWAALAFAFLWISGRALFFLLS
jgi:hypothetical protein